MRLNFYDVFRFFTETELTEQQRKFELICVCIAAVMFAAASIYFIVKEKRKADREKKDGSDKKSGN